MDDSQDDALRGTVFEELQRSHNADKRTSARAASTVVSKKTKARRYSPQANCCRDLW